MPTIQEQLMYVTTRIEAKTGARVSIGTGFFYGVDVPSRGTIDVVITNRHVVAGFDNVEFQVLKTDADGTPNSSTRATITTPQSNILYHPNPDIDLAAIPMSGAMNTLRAQGDRAYFAKLSSELFAPLEPCRYISPIEDVLMIGYPTGLWDETNNRPIMRSGTTATYYYDDFNGQPNFVVDIAAFSGSSGSPVFLYQNGTIPAEDEDAMKLGTRIKFLGVLHSGPFQDSNGRVVVIPRPHFDGLDNSYQTNDQSWICGKGSGDNDP